MNILLNQWALGLASGGTSWESFWETRTPTNLTLRTLSPTSIKVDWDNALSLEVDGHVVEISSDNITYTEAGTVTGGVITLTDTVVAGAYYYQVRAYKGTNYSPYSNARYINTTLTDQLVNYYDFNETSGSLMDRWGTNNGTLSGPTQQATGKIGTAYSFVTDDSISLTATHTFALADSITIDFWVKPNYVGASAVSNQILDRTTNINSIISIYYDAGAGGADLSFRLRGSDGAGLTTVTAVNCFPTAGIWYHVICERNRGSDNINVWVNNVAYTPVTDALTSGIGPLTLKIGLSQGNSLPLDAALDEMHIWRKVLTAGEKTALYNAGLGNAFLDAVNYAGGGLSAAIIPTSFSSTWTNDYTVLSFTDNSAGLAEHEIYESKDGGAYTLVTTLPMGVTTYNNYTWQNASMNFRVRAKIGSHTSAYSTVVNTVTPLVFKTAQSTLTQLKMHYLKINGGGSVNVNWGDGTDNTYGPGDNLDLTKDYSVTQNLYYVTLTGTLNSIAYIDMADQKHISGDISKWCLPTALTMLHIYGDNFTGNISAWTVPSSLTIFNVRGNELSGDMSNFYTQFPSTLADLQLSNNNFTGNLSAWTFPNALQHLNLFTNMFTGDLSDWVLPPLNDTLMLYGNSFSGDISSWVIPETLTVILLNSNGENAFTGDISGWTFGATVNPSNGFSITAINSGLYGDLSSATLPEGVSITPINFSNNHFTGLLRGGYRWLNAYNFVGNNCSSSEIDALLVDIDSYFVGGVVPLSNCTYSLTGSNMGIPSSIGLTAITSIRAKYLAAGKDTVINVNAL